MRFRIMTLLGTLGAIPATTHASGLTASVDVGAALNQVSDGPDLGLRIGYTLDIGNLHLTPELMQRLLILETDPVMGTFFGARLSHGHTFSPGIYGHGGTWLDPAVSAMGGGLSLDFRAIPKLVVGVHAGYTTSETGGFITGGGHAGIQL